MPLTRGLSHLPVAPGQEAEVLNRELIPYVREMGEMLDGDVASRVQKTEQQLTVLTERVRQIATFLGLP